MPWRISCVARRERDERGPISRSGAGRAGHVPVVNARGTRAGGDAGAAEKRRDDDDDDGYATLTRESVSRKCFMVKFHNSILMCVELDGGVD
jgi:hypothetical protein